MKDGGSLISCCSCIGAFHYILGNLKPSLRSKLNNIQLLLLAKYSCVSEYGIDRMIEPIVEDIKKLESVCTMFDHRYWSMC